MSRTRTTLLWLLGAGLVAAFVVWFLGTHHRVEHTFPLSPRGEASYNPLYALKVALQAQGVSVSSRQRLQLDNVVLGKHDTVLIYNDPRGLGDADWEALLEFTDAGGHLIVRLPPRLSDTATAGRIAEAFPIQPVLLEPHCMVLEMPGETPAKVFCGGARFHLKPKARARAAWRTATGDYVFARFQYGEGSVDVVSNLSPLGNGALREPAHAVFARQLLAPNWQRGTVHLVYAAAMPPLWIWLLHNAWMVLLPMLLGLIMWLWMRAPRFGPLLPSVLQPRRALIEHVEASGEHLLRYGKQALLHEALRSTVLARLRRTDPLAAAQDGDTQAALLAPKFGMSVAEIRATLDTRPPTTAAEFHHRIARLIALRKRL